MCHLRATHLVRCLPMSTSAGLTKMQQAGNPECLFRVRKVTEVHCRASHAQEEPYAG